MIGTLPRSSARGQKKGSGSAICPFFIVMAALSILMTLLYGIFLHRQTGGADVPPSAAQRCGDRVRHRRARRQLLLFLLMAAGLYDPLLTVLNTYDLPRLLPVALGFGVLCCCSPA